MAVYEVKDFKDIQDMVMEELKIQSSDTGSRARIQRDINAVYLNEVIPFKRWWWLMGHTKVVAQGYYSSGAVDVNPNETTATLSTAPTSSKKNHFFATDVYAEIYTISAHTADTNTLTLSSAYTGNVVDDGTFRIWTDTYTLPTDCRETVEVWHDFMKTPVKPVGLQEFRRIVAERPRAEGRPVYYTTYDFSDPSAADGETESDRYRVIKVHPALYNGNTTLHIDYIKEASPLELDGDEPIMPLEDRMVLVYGALSRAWSRERNPEEANRNQLLFDRKLAQMAGRVEDSQDTPKMVPSSRYMMAKRGPSLGRIRGTAEVGGGSYNAPTYLQNVTIEGGQITDDITVTTGITIDGRDVGADGLSLDTHIAATTAHGVTGDVVGTSDTQTLTNKTVDATDNTITNISNNNIAIDAAVELSKLEALTADSALVSNVSGEITASAVTATELSYVSGVTSAIQTQLDTKALDADLDAHTGAATGVHGVTGSVVGTTDAQTLTNKTLTAPVISTISNTGTLTLPTSTDTLVGRATTDTLTNKTIDGASNTISNVSLTTGVTGTLPIANGGTGQTSQTAAFDALAPTTTKGDIIVHNGTDNIRMAIGSDGQFLKADSAQSNGMVWASATTNLTVSAKTADYTAVTTDDVIPVNATSAAVTITLFTAVGNSGKRLIIKKTDSSDNAVTVDGNASETIDGDTTFVLRGQYDTLTIISDGANWVVEDFWFKPRRLTATSSQKTPGGNSRWLDMSGNDLGLPPGAWKLTGSVKYGNNGTTPGYTGALICKWASADGVDSSSEPSSTTVDGGNITMNIPNATNANSSADISASTVTKTVTSTETVFLVPWVTTLSTPGNARITTYIIAERVG